MSIHSHTGAVTGADDRLLTARQVAERWQIHPVTLAKARAAGSGCRFIRLGRGVRYPLSAVLAWEARGAA